MYPILFQIGSFSFFTHGILQAIGFLVAVLWFLKTAQKRHFHLEFIADHFVSLFLTSLIAARVFWIFAFWDRYEDNLFSIISIWDMGYLFWGGIAGFLIIFYYHCKKHQEKFSQWMEIIAPATLIALLFDTFGAFMGGDQYGTPTDLPWGVAFENPDIPFTIPIHPIQLYFAIMLIFALIVLQLLRQKNVKPSAIGIFGLLMFSLIAFFTEFFRGDEMGFYGGLRFTQIIELCVMAISIAALFFQKRRSQAG